MQIKQVCQSCSEMMAVRSMGIISRSRTVLLEWARCAMSAPAGCPFPKTETPAGGEHRPRSSSERNLDLLLTDRTLELQNRGQKSTHSVALCPIAFASKHCANNETHQCEPSLALGLVRLRCGFNNWDFLCGIAVAVSKHGLTNCPHIERREFQSWRMNPNE
jgi:hypothetical protein